MADTQTQHILLHRLKGEWKAEVNRLWSAARRMQKEGLRRPRSQRTSRRRADGGADEAEGGRGQGTERDATIDHSQHTNTQTFIHNTPRYANGHTKDKTFTPRTHHGHEPPDHPNPPTHPHDLATTESAAGSTAAASPGAERSPRPTQKRPPPANPTRPPPPPRAPPRACSKAVGEIKREQQTRRVRRCGRPCTSRKCVPAPPGRCLFTGTYIMLAPEHC